MTYRELLANAAKRLAAAGIAEAQNDARLLLFEAAQLTFAGLLAKYEDPVPDSVESAYKNFIAKRESRLPLQIIIGKTEFMGLEFMTDGKTLIPRQDTELLVEKALEYSKAAAAKSLLDICTGSGCIAIALCRYGSFERICAGDVFEEVLSRAKENAVINGADGLIDFRRSDMFDAFEGERFDVITCNPPYIKTGDIKDLMPEVKDYDPPAALDGGPDGLDFYRIIAKKAADHLTLNGALFLEIGYDQAREVSELLAREEFEETTVFADHSGNDRLIKAVFKGLPEK